MVSEIEQFVHSLDQVLMHARSYTGLGFYIAMAILSVWLYKRSGVAGSRELAWGYGLILGTTLVGWVVLPFISTDSVIPPAITILLFLISTIRWMCSFVLLLGFWRLFRFLVDSRRAPDTEPAAA